MNQAVPHEAPLRLYAAVVGACVCLKAFCDSISLAWDANSESDLNGYRIYYSRVPGEPQTIDAGTATSVTIPNLAAGSLYRIYATAYDSSGSESEPSTALEYQVPGSPETTDLGPIQITTIAMENNGLAITFPTVLGVTYVVEADDDFPSEAWKEVTSGIIGTGLPITITDSFWNAAPRRVYRIAATPGF
jgi:hypothetical protein